MPIYKTPSQKYCIRDEKKGYHGTYPTKEEAEQKLQQLINEGKIKPKSYDPMRYISKRGKKYRLRKVINGKEYHKTFDTLDEALVARKYMEDNYWGREHIRPRANHSKYTGVQYIIQKPNGRYVLERKNVHYGTYRTIIDAVKDKLFWESIDWDLDKLDLY